MRKQARHRHRNGIPVQGSRDLPKRQKTRRQIQIDPGSDFAATVPSRQDSCKTRPYSVSNSAQR